MPFSAVHNYTKDALENVIHEGANLKRFRVRLRCLTLLLVFCFLVVTYKLVNLSCGSGDKPYRQVSRSKDIKVMRANIVDRNGILIASNLHTASLYADSSKINDAKGTALNLSKILDNISYTEALNKLESGKKFVWIKRHLMPEEQEKVYNLGIPYLHLVSDERRVYPHKELLSHIVGHVDVDGKGLSGIERYFDNWLTNQSHDELALSLDVKIQYSLREELVKAFKEHRPEKIAGIVMDPRNGEVIAASSLPDFDPHNIKDSKSLFNTNTLGLYEMGSTLKLLSMAIALDTKSVSLSDNFDTSIPIKADKFTIKDYRKNHGVLTTPEVLIYSSNIGIAQIASRAGVEKQKGYLAKLGLLNKLETEIPELANPLSPQRKFWNEVSMLTISFGHGIAITPLHLSTVASSLVNGGLLYKPTFIRGNNTKGKRIFKKQTSEVMKKLMRLVVTKGYGKKANVDGYFVGGKTGTAEKAMNGQYNKKLNVASFVGAFPIYDPKYIILIVIDGAQPNAKNFGFTTGGMIAAPVAGSVIKRIADIEGIPPVRKTKQTEKLLFVNYRKDYKKVASSRRF